MNPARITLLVDWRHIREAERRAAGNHRGLRSGRLPGATEGPDGGDAWLLAPAAWRCQRLCL